MPVGGAAVDVAPLKAAVAFFGGEGSKTGFGFEVDFCAFAFPLFPVWTLALGGVLIVRVVTLPLLRLITTISRVAPLSFKCKGRFPFVSAFFLGTDDFVFGLGAVPKNASESSSSSSSTSFTCFLDFFLASFWELVVSLRTAVAGLDKAPKRAISKLS